MIRMRGRESAFISLARRRRAALLVSGAALALMAAAPAVAQTAAADNELEAITDRKSTRLNSSHS